jgi:nicotinate-nucleotide pyrophosphorylase (carboxylating)
MALPDSFDLDEFVQRVFAEDVGKGGDVTSKAVIAEDARFAAEMNARQMIVVAGLEIAAAFLRMLDADVHLEILANDGDRVEHSETKYHHTSNEPAKLAAERSAMNTHQH